MAHYLAEACCPEVIRDPVEAGIRDGRRAFAGPWLLEIDPINACNANCVLCWAHSPRLGSKRKPDGWYRARMPRPLVEALLSDAAAMGTREVQFAGGGEPLLYPELFECLARARTLGLRTKVLTNFIPTRAPLIDRLLEEGPDHLHVSLWAGSPGTYAELHPGKAGETYDAIMQHLSELLRARGSATTPFVELYHVICRANAHELERMAEQAAGVGADAVSFHMMDPIEGCTEEYLLDEEALARTSEKAAALAQRFGADPRFEHLAWRHREQFLRRLRAPGAREGRYDSELVSSIPCTAGWTYLRVEADGSLLSCCKAVGHSVGNVYQSSLMESWFSSRQDRFRHVNVSLRRGGSRFADIPCHKTCDNLEFNLEVARRLGWLASDSNHATRRKQS